MYITIYCSLFNTRWISYIYVTFINILIYIRYVEICILLFDKIVPVSFTQRVVVNKVELNWLSQYL